MVIIPFNNLTRKKTSVVTKSPSKELFTSHLFDIFFSKVILIIPTINKYICSEAWEFPQNPESVFKFRAPLALPWNIMF